MVSQAYERAPGNEANDPPTPFSSIPTSPPPSFRSRASSPTSRRLISRSSTLSDVDQTLADTFDVGDGSDEEDQNGRDDRQRLMQNSYQGGGNPSTNEQAPARPQRRMTELPVFNPPTPRTHAPGLAQVSMSNDGVFANLSAKPERGEKTEELPPSYEQAAADATPPYWETTILAPGMVSDEVYIDGLPLGSLFSFVWNAVISMSFQLVGFLLTYLLHTTHAAKNGSRAGLGITLVQYGFFMKGSPSKSNNAANPAFGEPSNPNSHDFDPSTMADSAAAAVASAASSEETTHTGRDLPAKEWLAYMLMIVGWFILIRAVTDFLKARRHEQLILQSPDRGLNVPIIMEGETSETTV